ncbi:uncharacterized protein LOC132720867 [Ruditapes philippinarum]|uniref:uncharacterized protein LOC132720867 n=1 Tax=Ruditapes philippinarum TaxID=129788 RepID=UPI00295AC1B8|nr:uncharacterized protein LOC132720867 [Ruditapes philippinarum]
METVLMNMKLPKDIRKEIEEKRRLHLNLQSICRSKYYKHIKKACESPDKYVSLIIDNMDQAKTRLPTFSSNSKVEAHLHKVQHHVTGVKAHHLGKTFILTWTDQFHPDCNITINALIYTLHEISLINGGMLPPTLYIQADNSAKDNKNAFFLTFLAWLVKTGIFKKVKLSFLMVGHTHEDIDQVFSRISCHMKHVDAPTLPALLHAIGDSTTPSPQVVNLEGIYNYKATLENVRGMIEGISGPHQFMIKKKEGKVILHYKDWPIDKATDLRYYLREFRNDLVSDKSTGFSTLMNLPRNRESGASVK